MARPPDLRWQLVEDGDPQGTLFEDVVERHIGRGEYRGMEFLHVNARRIINEVPPASRVPFRFTINAYRGCGHACTYCLVGDTPILMGDGTVQPISDLRPGDKVIGTEPVGRHRRYVTTPVLAHWSTLKPAVRTILEDGTELVASGDHRFLTERGWKHVTGSEQGGQRRSHLTNQNTLLGIGRFEEGPRHTADYQRGYLCGMIRGEAHLGHHPYLRKSLPSARRTFRLAPADLQPLSRTRRYLEQLAVPTSSSVLAAAGGSGRATHAVTTESRRLVETIESLIDWPTSPSEEWTRGFLAGIYDAEGHLGEVVRISNRDPVVLGWITRGFRQLGFTSVLERARASGVASIRLRGGLPDVMRFILKVDPATTRKRTITGRAMTRTGARRVADIEPTGLQVPMFDITTGTGDFIANGVVSHNCFARPTHEFLGMNAGEDFERRIVVKINAVERLRAELSPSKWSGEHIAMGTNTDPYQRCEAKYRLTRGIVGELLAARNSFSILTKSTLILSDLDLLAEAAKVTEVRANFSIGTLDEEVWRLTEPGTPHPVRRVEAVAKLNAAGVPCGVLVAPVLPGLSDSDEQLEAVVKACVEAGATSIAPILLHLRPGVREHYLGWLSGARPDLLALHERQYVRSYAPKATQEDLSRRVMAMVARHGGRTVTPRETRPVEPRPARPRAAPVRQLSLEV